MRENRPYGSVRGVAGDRYPYRDSACPIEASAARKCRASARRQAEACPTSKEQAIQSGAAGGRADLWPF